MRRVDVREFNDGALTLLAADERFLVELHGEPIGLYIPLRAPKSPIRAVDPVKARASMDRFGRLMTDLLERAGMTEEELTEGLPPAAPARR